MGRAIFAVLLPALAAAMPTLDTTTLDALSAMTTHPSAATKPVQPPPEEVHAFGLPTIPRDDVKPSAVRSNLKDPTAICVFSWCDSVFPSLRPKDPERLNSGAAQQQAAA